MLENVAQAVSEHDLASMSESEVDQFFEQFEPRATGLEPHFENFLGGLWKKAKSLANKAIDIAKKGLTLIPGIGALIGKLKALVRPILNRVLKTAIDKLPATLQPLARQLAQRVLGVAGEGGGGLRGRPRGAGRLERRSGSSTSRRRRSCSRPTRPTRKRSSTRPSTAPSARTGLPSRSCTRRARGSSTSSRRASTPSRRWSSSSRP